jgi:hypothetical protein
MKDPTSVSTGEGGPFVPAPAETGWFDNFSDTLSNVYNTADEYLSGGLVKINPVIDGMLDFSNKMSKVFDVGYGITGNETFADYSDRVNSDGVRVRESQGSINRNADRFKKRADAIKKFGAEAAAEKRKKDASKKKKTTPQKPKRRTTSGAPARKRYL